MRTLAASLALAALLLSAVAAGQPTQSAEELANDTVQTGNQLVDDVTGGLDGAAGPVDQVVGGKGPGLGDTVGGVGRFLQQMVLGAAAGMGAAGLAVADGLSAVTLGAARLGLDGAAAMGGLLGFSSHAAADLLAATALWLAAQLGALASLYSGFVLGLRPRQMPAPAFTALAATGTAVGAATAGWGLWTLVRRFAWLAAPVAGFSRIQDTELLDHPMRAQVFQVIQSNPGVHASELSRKVGAGWGTITHHLEKLEKGKLVTTRRVNNQKCYFEDGGKVSSQDMQVASAVRSDSAHQITQWVASHPMTSQKAMAEGLGISPALASFHVKKLVGVGVLEKVRRGKETLLTTTQAVRRIMTMDAPPVAVPQIAVQA
ncbi:MAG: hypothetical protein QOD77_1084 [Thermoplasmata archaeon]|jgi:DNA-binding transcriptional ArsR family regulator|nr:hypothetical protein [Thermoplasmata archaeon]